MDNISPKTDWYYQGLKWVRRHKDGVSEWRGTWRHGPPLWFCRMFLAFSLILGLVGIVTAALSWGKIIVNPGSFVFLFVSVVHGGVSLLSYRQRRTFSRLQETDELAAEMGLSEEDLARFAEERDIKPKVYFNDRPLYDPDDLVLARILLRPSAEPIANETLLRAAMPTQSPAETEQLLRASTSE